MAPFGICPICNEQALLKCILHQRRVCIRCRAAQKKICATCGNARRVVRHLNGQPICHQCWKCHPSQLATCTVCQSFGPVVVKRAGSPICGACYPRRTEPCSICGQQRPVQSRRDGRALCMCCYMAIRNGKDPLHVRRRPRRPRRIRICTNCGQRKLCQGFLGPTPLCAECAGRPLVQCVWCGEKKPVTAYWPGGPVCNHCAEEFRQKPKECTNCRNMGMAVPFEKRQIICRPCAGWEDSSRCVHCGQQKPRYAKGYCVDCYLRHVALPQLLNLQGASSNTPYLKRVMETLLSRKPISVVNWLNTGSAALLHSIAQGHTELSHSALDQHTSTGHAEFVRSILVEAGALPVRNRMAAHIDHWLEVFRAEVPDQHRLLIMMFAEWRIVRRLRGKIQHQRLTRWALHSMKLRLRIAVRFLEWLDRQEKTLQQCTQKDVECWLVESKVTTPYLVRDFLQWTSLRKFSRPLEVPLLKSSGMVLVDEDRRWAMIERLSNDESIRLELRLCGLFVLVFGQHVSRIVTLLDSMVQIDEKKNVKILFGGEPVVMPPVIASLLSKQLVACRRNPNGHRADGTYWLFPGRHYGSHRNVVRLQKNLNNIGVECRRGRNSALLQLASQLHPAVLGRLLHMSPNVAVRWSQNAGGGFNRYVASRTARIEKGHHSA